MSSGENLLLAYAHEDKARAQKVAEQLREAGFNLWSDADLRGGENWRIRIAEELRGADGIVLLVSPAAERSNWVRREIDYAKASRTPIFPVLLEGEPLPALSDLQHSRATPQGELSESELESIREVLGSRADVGLSPVVASVLEALENKRLGEVLDQLQSVVVLLLGNFSEDNLDRLLRIQAELQGRGWYPVIFDFEKPPSSDFGETVRLLAGIAGFVVADMSDPRSVVMELQLIAPGLAVPIVPLIGIDHEPVALFTDLSKYDWVLSPRRYRSVEDLISRLDSDVIQPALDKRNELRQRKLDSAAAQAGIDDTV